MKESLKRMLGSINPALLILMVLLLANNLLNGGMSLMGHLLMLPGIVVGLTFHEAAHGYVSHWLGDPTPKMQGRLSLNPLRHIDPIGFLALLFAGFGWGRPVEINPYYYKHRRRDEVLVSLAGVFTNFIIALLSALGLRAMFRSYFWSYGVGEDLFYIVYYMMLINLVLMIFNLLPVPPLDGFSIVTQLFKLDRYDWYQPLYRNGFFILMLLILFNVTDRILTPCLNFFVGLLL